MTYTELDVYGLVRTGGREMNYFYFHFVDETTEIQKSNLPRVLY